MRHELHGNEPVQAILVALTTLIQHDAPLGLNPLSGERR